MERIKNNEIVYSHYYQDYDQAENVGEEKLLGQVGSIKYNYDRLERPISVKAPIGKKASLWMGLIK